MHVVPVRTRAVQEDSTREMARNLMGEDWNGSAGAGMLAKEVMLTCRMAAALP